MDTGEDASPVVGEAGMKQLEDMLKKTLAAHERVLQERMRALMKKQHDKLRKFAVGIDEAIVAQQPTAPGFFSSLFPSSTTASPVRPGVKRLADSLEDDEDDEDEDEDVQSEADGFERKRLRQKQPAGKKDEIFFEATETNMAVEASA